ncbi:hypothetical protein HHK36_028257 [Tetracentron sinense]|uniref:ADP-ribosylation factor n=1 Tax=Tetracentron sinense TaxID=13715 RepID=A0A835D1W6_TETSI|nr:hypothetical protein HHK36_028257 [Tetracentron sinense]
MPNPVPGWWDLALVCVFVKPLDQWSQLSRLVNDFLPCDEKSPLIPLDSNKAIIVVKRQSTEISSGEGAREKVFSLAKLLRVRRNRLRQRARWRSRARRGSRPSVAGKLGGGFSAGVDEALAEPLVAKHRSAAVVSPSPRPKQALEDPFLLDPLIEAMGPFHSVGNGLDVSGKSRAEDPFGLDPLIAQLGVKRSREKKSDQRRVEGRQGLASEGWSPETLAASAEGSAESSSPHRLEDSKWVKGEWLEISSPSSERVQLSYGVGVDFPLETMVAGRVSSTSGQGLGLLHQSVDGIDAWYGSAILEPRGRQQDPAELQREKFVEADPVVAAVQVRPCHHSVSGVGEGESGGVSGFSEQLKEFTSVSASLEGRQEGLVVDDSCKDVGEVKVYPKRHKSEDKVVVSQRTVEVVEEATSSVLVHEISECRSSASRQVGDAVGQVGVGGMGGVEVSSVARDNGTFRVNLGAREWEAVEGLPSSPVSNPSAQEELEFLSHLEDEIVEWVCNGQSSPRRMEEASRRRSGALLEGVAVAVQFSPVSYPRPRQTGGSEEKGKRVASGSGQAKVVPGCSSGTSGGPALGSPDSEPRLSFNVEKVQYKNVIFTVWDVGGQEKLRPLWRHYFNNTDGLIYVVDSLDRERIGKAKAEFQAIIRDPFMLNSVILVFANKQDMKGAMTPMEVCEGLGLYDLKNRRWHIQGTCALRGDGLYEGLDWLAGTLKELKATGHSSSTAFKQAYFGLKLFYFPDDWELVTEGPYIPLGPNVVHDGIEGYLPYDGLVETSSNAFTNKPVKQWVPARSGRRY